ncbi:MAG: ROK family protein [Planctomycetaceae bacterium]
MTGANYLGIDIGGTSVKVGIVADSGEVLCQRMSHQSLDQGRDAGLDMVFGEVEQCIEASGVDRESLGGVGIAAPGTMDLDAGVILHPFNLPGWENLPLRRLATERLRMPAALVNDANAAAFGEYWAGAGAEARSLMLWTLGTGIGGGIVMDGDILVGAHGHAAECGQMIIQMEGGPRSEHGLHGSLELYAGARGLQRRCAEALAAGARSTLKALSERAPLSPLDIAREAEAGDELAIRLVLETARYLAIGTVNVMHTLNPEMFLFGGAMTFGQESTAIGRQFLAAVRETVREVALPVPAMNTVIKYAKLGNNAGFIGAAGVARRMVRATDTPKLTNVRQTVAWRHVFASPPTGAPDG